MNKSRNFFIEWSKDRRAYLLIVAVGFALYILSLTYGFTYLDDNVLILTNLFYLKDLGNIINAFKIEVFHILHASAAYYRPLLTISFILDAQISGDNPIFYHLTNVNIHILNTIMFFILMKRLKIEKAKALFISLIFLVHPILTQAVSWVPGRNDSLLALFILPSFIFFIDFLREGSWKKYVLHLIFFTAALFTKESAILFSGVCIFYLILIERPKGWADKIIYLVIGWFLLAVVWLFMRSNALVNPIHYTPHSIFMTVLNNSPAIILYLGKVFFPINLSVLPTLQDSTLVWGFLSIILILILFFYTKKKNFSHMLFYTGWFFVFLTPSFVRPNTVYVADFIEHRMYMPLIGLLLLMAEMFPIKGLNLKNKRAFMVCVAYLSTLFTLAMVHNMVFRNKIVFWEDAAKHSPSHPLSWKNLGAMYYLDGRYDDAEKDYREALRLNPSESMVHNNLGLIYAKEGDLDKAEKEYQEELKINPGYDNAYFNYGMLLYTRGDKENALKMWLMTIKVNPDHANGLQSLAHYYYEEGDLQKANYYANEAKKRGIDL
jgi:tetratricopeptide (TPR) repeat protein